jgi:homoserine O-acetyltransferase/O-succinyltransferase
VRVRASQRSFSETTVRVGDLPLDDGGAIEDADQRVTIYGDATAHRTVLVCHALTGSSRAADWWPGIVGDGALFDPDHTRVICVNVLGGCYGSSGPSSRPTFPRVTVGDMVRAQAKALERLGIEAVDVVIGGSLGGMQALQWALDFPTRVGEAVMVASHDHHSALGIALNAVQREALDLDPVRGLRLARKIAMLSYKSDDLFRERHDRRFDRLPGGRFEIEGYLERRADEFEGRIDAGTYRTLSHAMDAFDVRERATAHSKLPKLTFVGITSDWLFRAPDVLAAVKRLSDCGHRARYIDMKSSHGHDAFLAEAAFLGVLLANHGV